MRQLSGRETVGVEDRAATWVVGNYSSNFSDARNSDGFSYTEQITEKDGDVRDAARGLDDGEKRTLIIRSVLIPRRRIHASVIRA